MKYLIVKPSSLGDILHAMPAVSALSKSGKDVVIDWVVKPAFADLPKYLPCVRRVILFCDKKMRNPLTMLPEIMKFRKAIRQEHYDAVIDLQGLVRSAIIGRLADADVCAGPENPREPKAKRIYTRLLNAAGDREKIHAVEFNNGLIASFLNVSCQDLDFSMTLTPHRVAGGIVRDLLDEEFGAVPAAYFVIAPGARWKTKEWPPDFFANVIRELHSLFPDVPCVLAGSRTEQEAADRICAECAGLPVVSLCGRTSIVQLVELIRGSAAMVCNDSGPMHIAAALQVPVAALFAPTDPVRTGPYCEKKSVLMPDLTCNCCYLRYCKKPVCHEGIPASGVAEAVSTMLAGIRDI